MQTHHLLSLLDSGRLHSFLKEGKEREGARERKVRKVRSEVSSRRMRIGELESGMRCQRRIGNDRDERFKGGQNKGQLDKFKERERASVERSSTAIFGPRIVFVGSFTPCAGVIWGKRKKGEKRGDKVEERREDSGGRKLQRVQ